MDKASIAVAIITLFVLIGFRVDAVINRALPSSAKTGQAHRDLREVYWQADPIETKVVAELPSPGTTGDIKPEEHLDPNVSADELWAHPADYEIAKIFEVPPPLLGWSTEGRRAGFTYEQRNDMVDRAIETGDFSPLLEPELCCWCGLPFVSENGTVMCRHCREFFQA